MTLLIFYLIAIYLRLIFKVSLSRNCFSGDESAEYVPNQSQNIIVSNEYKGTCEKQLQHEPKQLDYDPYVAGPSYDIDVSYIFLL